MRTKWFLKCAVLLLFLLQVAGGAYFVLRPQLWSANGELTLSETAMTEVGLDAVYEFLSGPRMRALLGDPERYLSVRRRGENRVSFVLFSDEMDELSKRHARLKTLLSTGTSEAYRSLMGRYEKALTLRILEHL